MKKQIKLVAVVATLLISAAGVITIQSCKKEQKRLSSTQTIQNGIKHPECIEDMDAYLKSFGEQMLNSKENEILSIEEATWHLTAYQNFCFGDANHKHVGVVYDDKEYTIPVSEGMVSLAELGNLFQNSQKDILNFYKSTNYGDKWILYVKSNISESGYVKVRTAISYIDCSKYYYFDYDEDDFSYFCDTVFYNPDGYTCTIVAPGVLKTKMIQFGPSTCNAPGNQRVYYTNITNSTYSGLDYPERVFFRDNCAGCTFDSREMCELLDSYLGLLIENKPDGKDAIDCDVNGFCGYPENPNTSNPLYHVVTCIYGSPSSTILDPILD